MIIKALCEYYDALSDAERNVPHMGMEFRAIKYLIVIDDKGNFIRVENLSDSDNKNGQQLQVVQGDKRTSKVFPYTLWDKRKYILGDDPQDKKGPSFPKELGTFIDQVSVLCESYPDNLELSAIQIFYAQNMHRLTELEGVSDIKSNDWITFRIQGSRYYHVSQHPDIIDFAAQNMEKGDNKGMCMIYGKELPLATLHAKINLAGAEAQSTIVSFQKNQGFDSYGKQQGENAPISTKASFAHTTAINILLKEKETNYRLGDITYLFWNSLLDDSINTVFKEFAFAQDSSAPNEDSYLVQDTFKALTGVKGGRVLYGKEKEDGRFYILGIAPGGRIAVKYWKEGTIGEIFHNLYRHLDDMNIVNWQSQGDEKNPPKRSLYKMVKQVSSSDKSEQWGMNLIQSIVASILDGTPYPSTLQQACLGRVRLKGQVNETRASILKGCVNRNIRSNIYKNSKPLTMALDKSNTNVAYLLGRAFALLEKIQKEALGIKNSTIRDRFFASASTRPNTVFGRLISLSNHHLAKIRKEAPGLAYYFEKELGAIIAQIQVDNTAFPAVFNLNEQSLFSVGYYQQKAFREKKANKADNEENIESDNNEE